MPNIKGENAQALIFEIPGSAQPGGSKKGFVVPHYKPGQVVKRYQKVIITDANPKVKRWRRDVAYAAEKAYRGIPLARGIPIAIKVTFILQRPQAHYRTGQYAGQLKENAPVWHTSKPDTTKLLRAVEDALTGIIWADDAQICRQEAIKVYGDKPGVKIEISTAN